MVKIVDAGLRLKIQKLKDYFLSRSEIVMAFVFGSYTKGKQTGESDFDIAVYFSPEGRAIEWEEAKFYDCEDEIWSDIEKIIGIKTDMVVLNRAPSTLAFSIIREGIPVIIKNKPLYMRFLLAISSAAEYFRDFVNDFWAIKQRSMSLTDDDRERLIRTADFLESELKDYPLFSKNINRVEYETDSIKRRNTERWVENIVNSSIDISKILLASENKKIPQTYREILREMQLLEGFSSQIAEGLAQFAKLRNILAHEYLDIRFEQIKKFILESEELYKYLLDFVKKIIGKNR